jgi:hypothetical protein
MKQPEDSEPPVRTTAGLPDYVVVVSASDWVKEHFPAAGANLWDALHTGQDRHRSRARARSRTMTPIRK